MTLSSPSSIEIAVDSVLLKRSTLDFYSMMQNFVLNPSEEHEEVETQQLLIFQIQLPLSDKYIQISSRVWFSIFSGHFVMAWPVLLSLLHSKLLLTLMEITYRGLCIKTSYMLSIFFFTDLLWSIKGENTTQ